MIERFKTIKNIGRYKNAVDLGQCEFKKTTIIFGSNSEGKSTFCDILKSLSRNDSSYIEKRKTIDAIDSPEVEIKFDNLKSTIKYNKDKWVIPSEVLRKNQILIFDTEFVEKNIFTNSEINRKNSENFTDFILGEESIRIQKQLEELKEIKKQLEQNKDNITKDIELYANISFEDFSTIEYHEDVNEINKLSSELDYKIANLKNSINKIEDIKNYQLPLEICLKDDSIEKYEVINSILVSYYELSRNDIIKSFNEHKKKINIQNNDFDKWISEGCGFNSTNICPYCGSSLVDNKLVESYLIMFCDKFIQYTNNVDILRDIELSRSTLHFCDIKREIEINLSKIEKLKSIFNYGVCESYYNKLVELSHNIIKHLDCILNIKQDIDKQLEQCIRIKLNDKYKSVKNINIDKYKDYVKTISNLISSYNKEIENYYNNASKYLAELSADSLNSDIKKLQKEYEKNNNIINRNKYNDKYFKYLENEKQLKGINDKVSKLKKEFENAQSDFIEKFYLDINYYYKTLGSKNFNIELKTTNKGTKKIYNIVLNYHSHKIDNLSSVLSDSDKRALALSIFLSKLKNENQLKNFIIVMDDPITSFDNERMNLFINTLNEFDKANQIIILTHYQNFYRKFYDLMKKEKSLLGLLKILFLSTTNTISKVDSKCEPLLMDDFEQALCRMFNFIDGKTHDYSSNDARTFMHKYLRLRFYYVIKTNKIIGDDIDNLDLFLKALKNNDLIDEMQYSKLDQKRKEYNLNSHNFDTDLEMTKRNSIIELNEILNNI